jgi:hypothetical protein
MNNKRKMKKKKKRKKKPKKQKNKKYGLDSYLCPWTSLCNMCCSELSAWIR